MPTIYPPVVMDWLGPTENTAVDAMPVAGNVDRRSLGYSWSARRRDALRLPGPVQKHRPHILLEGCATTRKPTNIHSRAMAAKLTRCRMK